MNYKISLYQNDAENDHNGMKHIKVHIEDCEKGEVITQMSPLFGRVESLNAPIDTAFIPMMRRICGTILEREEKKRA